MTQVDKNYNEEGRELSQADLFPLTTIRTETVLSRMPIHNLAKRGNINIHIAKKNERGEIALLWKVSPNPDFGTPRQLAYKLDTLIINRKIDELGRPLPKTLKINSITEISKELGSQKNELKRALQQNATTVISAKLTYQDKDGSERYLEAVFTRYSLVFTGQRLPDGRRADAVYLILNDPYWEVLNAAPSRPLDYDYLKSLKPASQRFYEIVSYKIFAAIKYRHPVAKLAYSEYCTFSAQQRYYEYDRVKKQMYKIHVPHLKSGYIKSVSYQATIDEQGNPDWIMQYVPGKKSHAEYQFFTSKKQRTQITAKRSEENTIQTRAVELVGHFYRRFHQEEVISPNSKEIEQATELITAHGIDRARFIVDYSFDEAKETNYTPKFFGGILPYEPRALKHFDKQQARRRREDARQQEERLQRAYEVYKQREIKRIKSSLSPEELAEIEDSVRRELEAEGTFPIMMEMGVRMRTQARLEERAQVLPYDAWQNQQPHSSD